MKTWKQGQWKVPKCLTLNPSDLEDRRSNGVKRRISVSSDTYLKEKSPKFRRYSSVPTGQENYQSDCESDCENCEKNETFEPYTECWPRDWLPKDCPGVRVIAVTYTTDPYLWRPVWIKEKSRLVKINFSVIFIFFVTVNQLYIIVKQVTKYLLSLSTSSPKIFFLENEYVFSHLGKFKILESQKCQKKPKILKI